MSHPKESKNGSGLAEDCILSERQQEAVSRFTQDGFFVLRNMVAEPPLSFLYNYVLKTALLGKLKSGDSLVPNTPCCNSDPFMDSLLDKLLPFVEAATGRKLFPTYSYFRVYKRGDVLKPHSDRAACEFSLSLSLGYQGTQSWPIYVESNGATHSILIEPGDALLYKGIEIPHWRESFTGDHSAQVFLHYVDQNGSFRDLKFDGKNHLNISEPIERIMEQFKSCFGGSILKVP